MSMIKEFFTHKDVEAWVWMTINGFLVLSISVITDLNWQLAPVLIAVLNLITKYINTKFIK